MKNEILESTSFSKGWRITLEAAGKGFEVCLYQFNGFVRSTFRFNRSEAESIYNGSVERWPEFSRKPVAY